MVKIIKKSLENEYSRRQDRYNLWARERMTQNWPVKILSLIIMHGILLAAACPTVNQVSQHRGELLALQAAPVTEPA